MQSRGKGTQLGASWMVGQTVMRGPREARQGIDSPPPPPPPPPPWLAAAGSHTEAQPAVVE